MKDFLIEILTEEIPSAFALDARESLLSLIKKMFTDKNVSFGEYKAFVTPRRLAVLMLDVEEKSKDEIIEQKGPMYESAFKDGSITKAGSGFFKANNIDEAIIASLNNEENINSPYLKNISGKDYIYIKKEKLGMATSDIIKENFIGILENIKFPKKMRWADYDFPFVRPIRNITLMFGSDVIDVEITGIKSNNNIYGHRLLSPLAAALNSPKDYEKTLEDKYVVPSREKRLGYIISQIENIEKETNSIVVDKNKVSNMVVDLVEKPYLIKAIFNEKFLEVPKEVLTSEMIEHQKYFPMINKEGSLTNIFIITANQPETQYIVNGNKRVLTARLSDGRFLYQEDIKNGLDNMNKRLSSLMFRNKLGSMKDKVNRMIKYTDAITGGLKLPNEKGKIEKSIKYMKADLVSNMVYNFPELQGIMGSYFADKSGFDRDISIAIRDQYKPVFAKDSIPENIIGRIISIIDKLDNIIAAFYLGDIPTGSQDPNALRRQALGIIHIIIQSKWQLDIDQLISSFITTFSNCLSSLGATSDFQITPDKSANLTHDIIRFIKLRFENDISNDYSFDAIRGVLAIDLTDICDALAKIKAIDSFRKSREDRFLELLTVFKRISNIIKDTNNYDVKESILVEDAEKKLYEVYKQKEGSVKNLIDKKEYENAFIELSSLYEPIDIFFKDVLVMADDQNIKNNRIALLASIDLLFKNMLDFSALVK